MAKINKAVDSGKAVDSLLTALSNLENVTVTIGKTPNKQGVCGLYLGAGNVKTIVNSGTSFAKNLEKTGKPEFQIVGRLALSVASACQDMRRAAFAARPDVLENPDKAKTIKKVEGEDIVLFGAVAK